MSTLIVEVCQIDQVLPHNNADSLELCVVKGWQCVTQKGIRKVGDKIVYIPIDTIMPFELSEKVGVTKYLSNQRVKCAKLRGEPSFGVIIEPDDPNWEMGKDVAEHYGLTKYVPPIKVTCGDASPRNPLMGNYTDIENLRNFNTAFTDGEEVVCTEKCHGGQTRCGIVNGEWVAASKNLMRYKPPVEAMAGNLYWFAYTIQGIRDYVEETAKAHTKVLVCGEVYGKVQSLHYGLPGTIGFAAFDIEVDGKYLDYQEFSDICAKYNIPRVPEVYRGPYSLDLIKQHSTGKTLFNDTHIREGIVVKPVVERSHHRSGRVIFKFINDAYLFKREEGKITDSDDN
jgi:RNA ligase (TIGR02306 family)